MKLKFIIWLLIIALISGVMPVCASDVAVDISVNDISKAHPRLIVTSYNEITHKIGMDDYTAEQYEKIKKIADEALLKEAEGYYMEGYSFSKIVTNAALCYRKEKDRKYIDGIMKHLNKPVYYENVDTNYLHRGAEMSAMSFFYDWLYDVLTAEEKQQILKCLKAYLVVWRNAYEVSEGWVVRTMNMALINQSSCILAALAIADEEPELSDWFLKTAVSNISTKFGQFATGGGYDESIAYWVFVTEYLCSMLNSLETSTGNTYGMTELPGFERTGSFYINMCGPTGLVDFRYGDGPEDRRAYGAPGLLYMAKKYNNPEYGYWGKFFCSRGSDERFPNTAMSIVMYDPAYCEFEPKTMQLDNTYPGSAEAGSIRSSWDEPKALQLAYKGGGSIEGHSQLEAGNFIINALEMRWIEDFGWESYTSSDNFSGQLGKDNPRYTFFKNSAQGQNQFVINPKDAPPEQNPENHAPIIKTQTTADDSFSIVDLTPPYEDYVTKAHRGYRMYNGKQYMVVQDEVELKEKGDFWWFVNTRAGLQLGADRRSVTLFMEGQKMMMKILSDNPQYKFMITAAEPLYFTPSRDDNQEITGLHRIAVNVPDAKNVNLSVLFIPMYDEETAEKAKTLKYQPMAEWDAEFKQDSALNNIFIGGENLPGFRPDVVNYFIEQKEDMTITYAANDNVKVTLDTGGKENWTTAEIHVNEEGKNSVTYSLHCVKGARISSSYEIPVKSITASEAEESAKKLIDEDMSTYWISQNDGCWVQLDFGETVNIGALMIAFRYGMQRSHYFDLAVSEDGINYNEIGNFTSGGFTDKGDIISFPEVKGRYLKITGHGNSQNAYNAAFDIRAYKNYENAEAALTERDGKYLSSFDVVMNHTDIIKGETIKYTAITTDNHYNEYIPDTMKITVLNENEDIVKVNTAKKTITGIKEGNAILKFVIEADGVMMSKKINLTVSENYMRNLIAVADTYVEVPAPDINRGTRQDMTVRGSSDGVYDRIGYMRFDISAIKNPVKKAYVNVYGYFTEDEESGSLPIGVYKMSSDWEETKVTYNDNIQLDEKIGDVQFVFEKQWKKIDITQYLKLMLSNNEKELSIAFYQNESSPSNKIYTRESVYAPHLSYSLEPFATIDEKEYTEQILKNPRKEIKISDNGEFQVSGYFLGTAMRKSVPFITVKSGEESFSVAPVVLKNMLNRNAVFNFSMVERNINDLPVKVASILKGSRIIEIRVYKNSVLESEFNGNGKVKLELIDTREDTTEIPEVYYVNPTNMEIEKIQNVKLSEDGKIEINYTMPGIFAIN